MPELPEVETIKRQLSKFLPGLTLKQLELLDDKAGRFLTQKDLNKILKTKVKAIERRAKILLLRFVNDHYLAVHLKMTGQIILKSDNTKHLPNKHTRAVLYFSQDKTVYFQDLRKFGWLKIISCQQLLAEKLGPEPLGKDFTLQYFVKILKNSRRPIKILLLDQNKIAGIGNIYANEALFLAGVNPQQQANKLNHSQANKLFQQIILVLKKGIDLGGASDSDYLNAYGGKGKYQEHFLVYRRQNKPCLNCQTMISRISLGGRGTFYCSACQPE